MLEKQQENFEKIQNVVGAGRSLRGVSLLYIGAEEMLRNNPFGDREKLIYDNDENFICFICNKEKRAKENYRWYHPEGSLILCKECNPKLEMRENPKPSGNKREKEKITRLDEDAHRDRVELRFSESPHEFFCFRCNDNIRAMKLFEWTTKEGNKEICNACNKELDKIAKIASGDRPVTRKQIALNGLIAQLINNGKK